MKLSNFVFKNLHLFIELFVDSKDTELLKELVDSLEVYKWGVSEPGHNGRVLVSCASNGEVQKSLSLRDVTANWMLFFAFVPNSNYDKEILKEFDFINEIWSEGSSFFRCGGFEVQAIRQQVLLELIDAASES